MTIAIEQLRAFVSDVWTSMLGLEFAPSEHPPAIEQRSTVIAAVQISGNFVGAVALECDDALARTLSSAMLQSPVESLTSDEVDDAIGEIANMVGGSVKGALAGPNQLSLPSVMRGEKIRFFVPGTRIVQDLCLSLNGGLLTVRVYAAV